MKPALSVILFTTLAGTAQGLVVLLAASVLLGALTPTAVLLEPALLLALALLLAGLVSSFFHLGHPERAWRAVMMWRTSWLSREVLALPAFIGSVALWWLCLKLGVANALLPILCLALAMTLWVCTGMIYACIRFIQEWAHPITVINFVLMGLSSGLVLGSAMALVTGERDFGLGALPWTLTVTIAAWASRVLSLRRNAGLRPVSTLQSATGIRARKLQQKSMGMSAGAFNTREFFHHASQLAMKQARLGLLVLGFAVPAVCVTVAWGTGMAPILWLAVLTQAVGLLVERWFFFAQAQHPQNLYYQVVS